MFGDTVLWWTVMYSEFSLSSHFCMVRNKLFTHKLTSLIHPSPLNQIPLMGLDPGLIVLVCLKCFALVRLEVNFNFSHSIILPSGSITVTT